MMTSLYLLKVIGDVNYDSFDSRVVEARDEWHARAMCNERSADEGPIWQDPTRVTCDVLTKSGEERIIISSFNAG